MINRKNRNATTKKYKDKPLLMGTSLLRQMYSDEKLNSWTGRGQGKEGVPIETMAALKGKQFFLDNN